MELLNTAGELAINKEVWISSSKLISRDKLTR
jgi:hypothetical protein